MDVEQRARDALNAVSRERQQGLWHETWHRGMDVPLEAVCRLIEQHDAYKREVSDAVVEYAGRENDGSLFYRDFSRFILSEPVDPLVEVMNEMGFGMSQNTAEDFREALAKRGLTIAPGEKSDG
jgi:hypothetical protein